MRALESHNEDDYRGHSGLDERLLRDADPSRRYVPVKRRREMCHCRLAVVTRLDVARLGMGR